MSNFDIVNIVGGGEIGEEIDLEAVAGDLEGVQYEYRPENFPGIIFRYEDLCTTIMLFRSGKFSLAGSNTHAEAQMARDELYDTLTPLLGDLENKNFEVRYIVAVSSLDQEVNLNEVVVNLGMEQSEYEPEQFPGVIYKPKRDNWMAIIFNNGKLVISGPDIPEIESGLIKLNDSLVDE